MYSASICFSSLKEIAFISYADLNTFFFPKSAPYPHRSIYKTNRSNTDVIRLKDCIILNSVSASNFCGIFYDGL